MHIYIKTDRTKNCMYLGVKGSNLQFMGIRETKNYAFSMCHRTPTIKTDLNVNQYVV